MRVALVSAAVIVAGIPATAAAADLTPAGPATLTAVNLYPAEIAMADQPYVLTGWRVVVGEGSSAGTVRPRFRVRATNAVVTGDPVELPAEPGTYTFAAPRLTNSRLIGLEQTSGEHAIVTRPVCHPEWGPMSDPCQIFVVDVTRDGQADERITGTQLALEPIHEPDVDQDLRGDATEDRTDLQLSMVPRLGADCRWRVAATVRNAGPLPADRPALGFLGIQSRWEDTPAIRSRWESASAGSGAILAPLAVGESRTLTLLANLPAGQGPFVTASAEGPDLATGDNTATFALSPAPAFTVTTPKRQSLGKGIRLGVRGSCNRQARLIVAFKVRGHTIRVARTVDVGAATARTLTLRPAGAKLRSLRRAVKRGPLSARITVSSPDGENLVAANTVFRR